MAEYLIRLPQVLRVTDILDAFDGCFDLSSCEAPDEITFDFTDIGRALPTGIVFLHNLTRYLEAKGCQVYYLNNNQEATRALKFMDRIGFFEDHVGHRLFNSGAMTGTTLRLREFDTEGSHQWVTQTFIPWLAGCSGIAEPNLADIQVCVKEIFNNVQDHAGTRVGSVFAQWYPNGESVDIAISDFGRGIPANVRRLLPELSAAECVIKAFEEGFTTKGHPANQGAGLHLLRQNVVDQLEGTLHVISGGAVMHCDFRKGFFPGRVSNRNHGYTGTLINISLPTQRIDRSEVAVEDGIW